MRKLDYEERKSRVDLSDYAGMEGTTGVIVKANLKLINKTWELVLCGGSIWIVGKAPLFLAIRWFREGWPVKSLTG